MIIHSLTVENFRSFYGEQKIEFSTDKEKNTTIIYAMNGVGKTNLLNAVLWCLHNMFSPSFKSAKELLNRQAKKEGRKTFHVSLVFEEDGNEYRVLRTGGEISNFKVFRILEDGNNEEISKNSTVFINNIIPKDMANYFISDGESGELAVNANGFISVKRSIRDILGFQVAEKALEDLNKIKIELRNDLKKYDVDSELTKSQDRLQNAEESDKKKKASLEQTRTVLEGYIREKLLIDTQIEKTNVHAIRQAHKDRIQVEHQLRGERNKLFGHENKKIDLIREYSWVAFAHKLSNEALDFIDESELRGKIPAPFNEQLVKDILEQSQCICGAEIKPNTESFNRIKSLLAKAADPDLLNRLQKARSRLTAIQTLSPQGKIRLEENFQDCDEAERNIKTFSERLQEISITIQDSDVDYISRLESDRLTLNKKIAEANRTIGRNESDLQQNQKMILELRGQISRMENLSPHAQVTRNKINTVEGIESVISSELEDTLKNIKGNLEEKINEFMDKYLRQDYFAHMNDEFQIALYDRNNQLVPPSEGQSAILSFIYISSLIAIARERRDIKSSILTSGAIAPLFFDAPFSKLDPNYAPNVAKELPKLVDQLIVLMYQNSSNRVDDVITKDGKLGKVFYLQEEIAAPQGSKLIAEFQIADKTFPASVYDASRDKVLIKEALSNV